MTEIFDSMFLYSVLFVYMQLKVTHLASNNSVRSDYVYRHHLTPQVSALDQEQIVANMTEMSKNLQNAVSNRQPTTVATITHPDPHPLTSSTNHPHTTIPLSIVLILSIHLQSCSYSSSQSPPSLHPHTHPLNPQSSSCSSSPPLIPHHEPSSPPPQTLEAVVAVFAEDRKKLVSVRGRVRGVHECVYDKGWCVRACMLRGGVYVCEDGV